MAKLTPAIKQNIVKKFKEGIKISKIAQCYDVDHQAIRYVIKNYEKFGETSLVVKIVGRKKLPIYQLMSVKLTICAKK